MWFRTRFRSALLRNGCAILIGMFLSFPWIAGAQRRGSTATSPESDEYPIKANSETERRILAVISDAVKARELYANVPAVDGRMLRLLAESVNAKVVAEIGTSTGISGLWFCMALDKTGGHLTTFELDPARAATAASHFKKAGVDRLVTIVRGDAHQNLRRFKESVDLAFIDAEKDGYIDYLNTLLPIMRPGGLILAHNVDMVRDYVKAVTSNPALDTVFYMQGGGLAVSVKKR